MGGLLGQRTTEDEFETYQALHFMCRIEGHYLSQHTSKIKAYFQNSHFLTQTK
jgi:hypothetical protein